MGDSGNLKHPIYLINQTTATPISPLLKNVLLFNRRGDHDFISDPINVGMEELRTEVHFSNKKDQFSLGKIRSSNTAGSTKSAGMPGSRSSPK